MAEEGHKSEQPEDLTRLIVQHADEKRQFRLPEFDGDDAGQDLEDARDFGDRKRKALLYAVIGIGVQIIWPLPLPLLLLFGALGVCAGVAFMMESGGLALLFLLLYGFFSPDQLGLHLLLGATSAFVAGLSISVGIATVVRDRMAEKDRADPAR